MIASVIGKTLLAEYNRRQGTSLTAEEFFDQVFHPIFYDHGRYLQWVTNSPFVQGYKKDNPPDVAWRADKLAEFKRKIHNEGASDASIAIGFSASGTLSTTSGQVTDLSIPLAAEDVYASWIGGGLGIGVQGGFSIYFNHPEILWMVFEGWSVYRKFLEDFEILRSNQIDTWNGQWFSHACSEEFNESHPSHGMMEAINTKDGLMEVKTQSWTKVLFGVARKFDAKLLSGYVFSLGQMNTTIGFVPFNLPELRSPLQFYRTLFGENDFLDNKKSIENMYGTAHSFRSACRKGAIGIPALEPKDLAQYMSSSRGKSKNPDFEKADQEKRISFNVYQSWLMAMLNDNELWNQATDAAEVYLEYVANGKKVASRTRENAIDDVLSAFSKRKFIEACIVLVKDEPATAERVTALVEKVNSMPEDNFRYFQTLVKFRHAALKSQEQKKGDDQ